MDERDRELPSVAGASARHRHRTLRLGRISAHVAVTLLNLRALHHLVGYQAIKPHAIAAANRGMFYAVEN